MRLLSFTRESNKITTVEPIRFDKDTKIKIALGPIERRTNIVYVAKVGECLLCEGSTIVYSSGELRLSRASLRKYLRESGKADICSQIAIELYDLDMAPLAMSVEYFRVEGV
jgi:hypothetical protein